MKKARKLLALLLAAAMLLALTACGKNQADKDSDGNNVDGDRQDAVQQEMFDEQKVLSQLDVKEYRTPVDGYPHYAGRSLVYLVKNNSQFNVKVTFKITTYNANDEAVQIFHEKISLMANETEKVLQITDLKEYENCRYELQAEEIQRDVSAKEIEYELIKTEEKIFLTVTNNREDINSAYYGSTRSINAYMLCFRNGKMLDCHRFFYYIEPSESETKEWKVNFDERYDSYKLVVF